MFYLFNYGLRLLSTPLLLYHLNNEKSCQLSLFDLILITLV